MRETNTFPAIQAGLLLFTPAGCRDCPELRQAGALSSSVHMRRDGKGNDRRGGDGFQQGIFGIKGLGVGVK